MKRKFEKYSQIGLMLVLLYALSACKKQNIPTPLNLQKPTVYSEEYYVKLREYKNSDHARCFIWLSDYGVKGGTSPSLGERFAGVPDSVDYISLWGGLPDSINNPNDYKEMRFAQRVKGTKLLSVTILQGPGPGKFSRDDQGIKDQADFLIREVFDHDLDGLDLDFEPEGSFYSQGTNFIKLVTRLSQFLGPKSGTGKILDVDFFGEFPPNELAPYVDFVVQQAYGTGSAASLQQSFDRLSGGYKPGQYYPAETFGDYYQTGGVTFTDVDGKKMNSFLGFAKWNPTQGRKGGFGNFFVQRDYYNPDPYGYTRQAIQAANPAKK